MNHRGDKMCNPEIKMLNLSKEICSDKTCKALQMHMILKDADGTNSPVFSDFNASTAALITMNQIR